MIVVRLMGGLGNQMFQYATAYALAKRNNTEVKIDVTLLEQNKKHAHEKVTHRELDLETFNLKLVFASQKEIDHFNGKVHNNLFGKIINKLGSFSRAKDLILETGRGFNEHVLNLKDNKCLVGAWQSESYFSDLKEEIKKIFKFKMAIPESSKEIFDQINNVNSVCVNVRRGDYITSPIYSKNIGALQPTYYNSGINWMEEKLSSPHFFVFSDDVEWCKSNIVSKSPLHFIGHEHAGVKFNTYIQLMSKCKHFVISNSTFAWWAAYLGEKENTNVVAPVKWSRSDEFFPKDIIPGRWIKMENSFE